VGGISTHHHRNYFSGILLVKDSGLNKGVYVDFFRISEREKKDKEQEKRERGKERERE
jgi:hypothetical protein